MLTPPAAEKGRVTFYTRIRPTILAACCGTLNDAMINEHRTCAATEHPHDLEIVWTTCTRNKPRDVLRYIGAGCQLENPTTRKCW